MTLTKEERDKIFECSGQNHDLSVITFYTEDKIEIYCHTCKDPEQKYPEIGLKSLVLATE